MEVPAVGSHGWRSILHGRELLKDHLGKVIGNGQTTRVWKDNWIGLDSTIKPIGPVHESALDLRVLDLLTSDLQWNKKRLEELLPAYSRQIQCLKPSLLGAEDSYIWQPVQSGVYSTKSGYNKKASCLVIPVTEAPTSLLAENLQFNWIKDVWSGKFSPKLRCFFGQLFKELYRLERIFNVAEY